MNPENPQQPRSTRRPDGGSEDKSLADVVSDKIEGAIDALTPSSVGERRLGAPGAEPPDLEEPTAPREPLPPREEQSGPAYRTPTGVPSGTPAGGRSQQGAYLTTSQGVRLGDTDHSLKAGRRGPTLLQDHHLREKITHFDHERIPERVVHARGAGAHGVFESYGTAASLTRASFLAEGVRTPVFVRFSTVLGSRGSADTVRDTRGFATKFYTSEGTFDLVANNIPVFFIQDGIKFPDVIHAGKPHPDREIPQAQSAHDTFWDFVSLHTEAQHHTMWNMSDRGIPRSYRMMEGFGVHTFRLVDAEGATTLVKLHWKPMLGVHSLTWEEAQVVAGTDPDYHRRDLYDAIEAGAFPQWELGLQVFPDAEDQTFQGIDLLDPTKIVPEELAPVQAVGRLTLNANPHNFFAETEQVAFHPGNLPPGIDVTDDPLLQTRLFSYLDTQLTRLGGPNFSQIPINRPHAPVNDMLREGFHQHADHVGVAPYRPNSLDGGCPFTAGQDLRAFVDHPVRVAEGRKERANPASFDGHYSQPRLFWASLSAVEKEHVIGAYSFELAKCYEPAIRERQLKCLAQIDQELCASVAAALGVPAPEPAVPPTEVVPSPALSQLGRTWPADGRMVALVVDQFGDTAGIADRVAEFDQAGVTAVVVAATGGTVDGIKVGRTLATARAVEFDALIVAGAPTPGPDASAGTDVRAVPTASSPAFDARPVRLLEEAWRHCKPIGAWGAGSELLSAVGIAPEQLGVAVSTDGADVVDRVVELLGAHRVWDRFPARTL